MNIDITYQRETSIPAVRAEACRESLSHPNNILPTFRLIYVYLYINVHILMNSTSLLTTPVEILWDLYQTDPHTCSRRGLRTVPA